VSRSPGLDGGPPPARDGSPVAKASLRRGARSRLPWRWRNAGQRPTTITILTGLLLAKAAVSAALAVGLAIGEAPFISTLGLPSLLADAGDSATVTGVLFALAAVLVVAAIGLFGGRRLGWLLAMVTTGVFIAADIVTFGAGTAHHLWMLLNIATVFYLSQRDVREAFLTLAGDAQVVEAPT
jgi:amino acid transporter